MSSASPARRAYHAPARQRQAEQTRQRVLEAARALFRERGYAATSIEAIATRAEVATPTVYARFGSKAAILTALVHSLKLATDTYERVRALVTETDPRRQLALGASISRDFAEHAWDVLDTLRSALGQEADLLPLWDEVEGSRYRDQLQLVGQLAEQHQLRPGLSVAEAADLYWTMSAHDTYRLLVIDRGWQPARYESWLAEALCRELLEAQ